MQYLVLSQFNFCSLSNHIFNACCKKGAFQRLSPSITMQMWKREHIVFLRKTPVNPHFPSVSKIIELIRLASLISCLWNHKNQNFIGGWSLRHSSLFIRTSISVSCVKLTVINEHWWKKKKTAAANWSYQGHPLNSAEENKTDKDSSIT